MIKIVIASLGYLLLFAAIEFCQRRLKVKTELTRKVAHITAGVSVALLPWVMSSRQIAVLGGLFTAVMLISKSRHIFSSIHEVKRKTSGEVYFPLAVLLCALLFPRRAVFGYGILVMAVSDAVASIIGQKYGKSSYLLLGATKTYAGSVAFFACTVLIGISFIPAHGAALAIMSAGLAVVLTLVEASLDLGLDNLVLPLVGSGLLSLWLRLAA